uniref:INCENP_ARK-bind domain-containing protein n=1 Tax=Elaeophora elaphi TaxID=1147741 RepID=A0A0R3RG41_9BILA
MELEQQLVDGNPAFPTTAVQTPLLELGIFHVKTRSDSGNVSNRILLIVVIHGCGQYKRSSWICPYIRTSLKGVTPSKIKLIRMSPNVSPASDSSGKSVGNSEKMKSNMLSVTSTRNDGRKNVSPKKLAMAKRILEWEQLLTPTANNLHYKQAESVGKSWNKNKANVKFCANLPFFDRGIFNVFNRDYSSTDGTEVCPNDGGRSKRRTEERANAAGKISNDDDEEEEEVQKAGKVKGTVHRSISKDEEKADFPAGSNKLQEMVIGDNIALAVDVQNSNSSSDRLQNTHPEIDSIKGKGDEKDQMKERGKEMKKREERAKEIEEEEEEEEKEGIARPLPVRLIRKPSEEGFHQVVKFTKRTTRRGETVGHSELKPFPQTEFNEQEKSSSEEKNLCTIPVSEDLTNSEFDSCAICMESNLYADIHSQCESCDPADKACLRSANNGGNCHCLNYDTAELKFVSYESLPAESKDNQNETVVEVDDSSKPMQNQQDQKKCGGVEICLEIGAPQMDDKSEKFV